MKIWGSLLGLLMAGLHADESAERLAADIYFVNHFLAVDNISYGSRKQPMQLINRPAGGKKPQRMSLERHLNNVFDQGEIQARDLVIFRSGKLRGTGILVDIYKDQDKPMSFAIWMPVLRKIRRHSQPDPADVWGGSVFTYGDIYLRKPSDETHKLLEPVVFDECLGVLAGQKLKADCSQRGRTLLRMRSTNKRANDYYDYRLVYIDPVSHVDYRSVYYRDDKAIKIIDKSWHSMGLDDPRGQYWSYWYGKDLRTGSEGMAWIKPDQIRWNQSLNKKLWSLSTLRRLSR